MIWFWVVVLVLIIGAAAVVIAGRGDAMTDVYEDRPDLSIDRGPLSADEVARVRFTTAVRGYRMDEVDAFGERIAAELRVRSAEEPLDETEPVHRPMPVEPAHRKPSSDPDDVPATEASPSSAQRLDEGPTTDPDDVSVPSASSDAAGGPSR